MNTREKAYNSKLTELMAATGRLSEKEVQKVLAMLETSRMEVAARIAETEWQAHRIPELKSAIDQAIGTFRQSYALNQNAALANSWEAGVDMIDGPLRTAGFYAMLPELSRTTLEILQGYSADLIGGLTADLTKKINQELTAGIIGLKTPHQVMQAIGLNLDDKGVYKSIRARAEAITRTEMARVHSLSRQARIQATVAANPDMGWKKRWHSSGKANPRPHHAKLNGVVIDVKEKFLGYIDYPHAPGLAAKEVVLCGCTHTLEPDFQRLPDQWEAMPYHERAIYD